MNELTHDDLVEHARKWLLKGSTMRKACSLVITDMTSSVSETPDAIGWTSCHSVLVECKATVSDFKSDSNKNFRRHPDKGVGSIRYYMTPKGLLDVDDVPETWGLVEVDERGRTRVKKTHAQRVVCNHRAEVKMLISLFRRMDFKSESHVNIRRYKFDTSMGDPRASVTVEKAVEE